MILSDSKFYTGVEESFRQSKASCLNVFFVYGDSSYFGHLWKEA